MQPVLDRTYFAGCVTRSIKLSRDVQAEAVPDTAILRC